MFRPFFLSLIFLREAGSLPSPNVITILWLLLTILWSKLECLNISIFLGLSFGVSLEAYPVPSYRTFYSYNLQFCAVS
jgi:hypothetical protein